MNQFIISIGLMISLALLFPLTPTLGENNNEPVPVDSVNLKRYTGIWYEIAKIPNRFQRKCVGSTTAQYSLRDDGRIDVVNRCIVDNGQVDEIKGIAKVVDEKSNAKLKVSFVRLFGISLFWGDYWIIGLDEKYEYAIIGTPNRKYGWILGRKPMLSTDDLQDAFTILTEQGYDPKNFEMTEQVRK
jgi:apolipoprotein D and lipocalin family protein